MVTHPCGGCSRTRLRDVMSRKVGRCARCIRLAALGALAGWALSSVAALASLPTFTRVALAVTAALFTLLWVAHVVVFMARALARSRRAERRPERDAGGRRVSRGAFVSSAARAAGIVVVVSLGKVPAALAQDGQKKKRYCVYRVHRAPKSGSKPKCPVKGPEEDLVNGVGDVVCLECQPSKNACNTTVTCTCYDGLKGFCSPELILIDPATGLPAQGGTCGECPKSVTLRGRSGAVVRKPVVIKSDPDAEGKKKGCFCSHFE